MKKPVLRAAVLAVIALAVICLCQLSAARQIDRFIASDVLFEEAFGFENTAAALQAHGCSSLNELRDLYLKAYHWCYPLLLIVTAIQIGAALFARHKRLSGLTGFLIAAALTALGGLAGYAATGNTAFPAGISFGLIQGLLLMPQPAAQRPAASNSFSP